MKFFYSFFTGISLLFAFSANAQQKISDAGLSVAPNADAILELSSSNKGLLYSRIALESTNLPVPLKSHVAGMMVYNTQTKNDVFPGMYYNNGTKWVQLSIGAVNNIQYNPITNILSIYNQDGSVTNVDYKNEIKQNETETTLVNNGTSFTYINEKNKPVTVNLLAGPIGPVGASGRDGDKGDIGNTGPQGPAGPIGANGKDGINGVKGDTGTSVLSGNYNIATGIVTFTYSDGSTSSTSDIRGAQGLQGLTGVAGLNGVDGAKGDTGTSVVSGDYDSSTGVVTFTYSDGSSSQTSDIRGAQGPIGLTGSKGDSGTAGTIGLTGAKGDTGTSVVSGVYDSSTGVVTFTYSDGSSSQTSDIRGAQGLQGLAGIQGDTGVGVLSGTYDSGTGTVTIQYTNGTNTITDDLRGGVGLIVDGTYTTVTGNGKDTPYQIHTKLSALVQDTATGNIQHTNEDSQTSNAVVISKDADNLIGVGTDGGAKLLASSISTSPQVKTIPRYFYAPSIVLPVANVNLPYGFSYDTTTQVFRADLYTIYESQYSMSGDNVGSSRTAIRSDNLSNLPVFAANDLDYFVTYFDNQVFDPISITLSATGILTYKVLTTQVSEHTYMNIVFKVK